MVQSELNRKLKSQDRWTQLLPYPHLPLIPRSPPPHCQPTFCLPSLGDKPRLCGFCQLLASPTQPAAHFWEGPYTQFPLESKHGLVPPLGMPASPVRALARDRAALRPLQLLPDVSGQAQMMAQVSGPLSLMRENTMEVWGSGLWPGSALAAVVIQGVNQHMGGRSLSLFNLPFCVTLPFR